jgi:hypothetical protein
MICAPVLVFGGTYFHVLPSVTRFWRYGGRQVSISCFASPNSFSTVSRASVLVSYFTRPDSLLAVPRVSGPVFMFCAPGLVFDGSESLRSRFHGLHSRTRFRPCLVRGSRFHVLRVRTHFRRHRGRPIPFSCFPLRDMFSVVRRASGPVLMFCAHRLISGGTEGVRSRFDVLRSRTHFRLFVGCRVPFSCFARPDSFSAVTRASGPVFLFCRAGTIFGGNEGVGSRFSVLRSQTHLRRFRGRRVSFSYFATRTGLRCFPRASGPIFMFYAPEVVSHGTEVVVSHFHVLRSRTHFRR